MAATAGESTGCSGKGSLLKKAVPGRRGPLTTSIEIGVIGAGAVAERCHLPALDSLGITPRLLVDVNRERAQAIASRFGIPEWGGEVEEAFGRVDAAIVATPPAHHAVAARGLLDNGVDVL